MSTKSAMPAPPDLAERTSECFAEAAFIDCNFDDDVWYVRGTNHDRFALSWSAISLGDGSSLRDPVNIALKVGAKFLLALIGSGAAARSRKPRGTTLFNHFCEIKRLVIWMSSRGLRAFPQLSLAHLVGYRNFMRGRRVAQRGRGKVEGRTKLTSVATQNATLQTALFLIRLQGKMLNLGTCVDLQEAEDILRSSRFGVEVPTPRIPDHTFRQLVDASIRFVQDVAPLAISMESRYRKWRSECAAKKGEVRGYRVYSHFRSALPGTLEQRFIMVGDRQIDLLMLDHHELRRLLMATRAACFVLIAGLVGMRVSEIRSLKVGCLKSELLGDGRRILRLHGTLYKTARHQNGEPAAWVAGWDDDRNPVALAVRCLEELARDSEFLFGRLAGGSEWIIQSQTVRHSFDALLDVVNLPGNWHFSTHQFRKTFARFVALSGPSAAVALMRHFKHVSIQMTERYFPNDPELLNEIIEASEELIAERLTSVLGAEKLGGIRGQEIIARNDRYRGETNASDLAELVKMTMADTSTQIVLHVYGMCFYDRDTAKCGGDVSEVGISACVRCVNFATGEEHIPFWKEQHRLVEANIAMHAENGLVNAELQRQLEEAGDALTRLGPSHG
jgi:integrase